MKREVKNIVADALSRMPVKEVSIGLPIEKQKKKKKKKTKKKKKK